MTRDTPADRILQLEELEILVVVDNETDTLSSIDEGVPQIPEVVHLAGRLPANRMHNGYECKTVFDQLCCACHGLSVLITDAAARSVAACSLMSVPIPTCGSTMRGGSRSTSRQSNMSSCRTGISITAAAFRESLLRLPRRARRRTWRDR